MSDNMKAELVVDTFRQAAGRYDLRGAISHSDRGSQYTSVIFREMLAKLGIIQSMNGAAGNCHDNAKCESLWARSKQEIMALYDTKKMTCSTLRQLLFRYYLVYWNNRRICSAIGGLPPMAKRDAYYDSLAIKCPPCQDTKRKKESVTERRKGTRYSSSSPLWKGWETPTRSEELLPARVGVFHAFHSPYAANLRKNVAAGVS